MAHEMTSTDSAAFGSSVPAWHGLGTVIDGQPDGQSMLRVSGLDWEVEKIPAYFAHGSQSDPSVETFTEAPGAFITVRNDLPAYDAARVLGAVGPGYVPIQNAECLTTIADALLGEGVKFETAGSLMGGKLVYMLAVLPESFKVRGDDHRSYLLISNAHDGSRALRIMRTSVRVVCHNTLSAAEGTGGFFRVRHNANATAQIDEARRVLGLVRENAKAEADFLEKLAAYPVGSEFVNAYVAAVFKKSQGRKTDRRTAKDAHRDRVKELFYGGQIGGDRDSVRGSAFGLLSATTEFIDHERNLRDDSAEARFSSIMFGSGAALRKRATDLLRSATGIGTDQGLEELALMRAGALDGATN